MRANESGSDFGRARAGLAGAGAARGRRRHNTNRRGTVPSLGHRRARSSPHLRRWLEDRTMKTYTVTYNVTLTIEGQADRTDEAERLRQPGVRGQLGGDGPAGWPRL